MLEPLKKIVSRNIRRLRKAAEMTQEQLAIKAKLNTHYIARLEGRPQNMTLEVLEALAKALKCTVAELVGGKEKVTGVKVRQHLSDIDDAIKLISKAEKAKELLEAYRDRMKNNEEDKTGFITKFIKFCAYP